MKVYHGKNNRSGIRDYNKRRYGNPLFGGKNKSRGRKRDYRQIRRWLFGVAVLGIFITGLWYLFWSPAFTITEIDIQGASADTELIIRQTLESRLNDTKLLIFPQFSVFLYDTKSASEDIKSQFFLSNLEIRKKLPHSVLITVEERTAVASFLADGEFWATDETGFIVRKLTKRERISMVDLPEGMEAVDAGELGAVSVDVAEIEGESVESKPYEARQNSNPLPLVLDRENSSNEYEPGDEAVSVEVMTLILQTYARLPDITGTGVRWFALESAADTVDVFLREGWYVYLTTMVPFDTQSERLALVMREKIGERRLDLEYVDLRYDERIFYRFKDGIEPEE